MSFGKPFERRDSFLRILQRGGQGLFGRIMGGKFRFQARERGWCTGLQRPDHRCTKGGVPGLKRFGSDGAW